MRQAAKTDHLFQKVSRKAIFNRCNSNKAGAWIDHDEQRSNYHYSNNAHLLMSTMH